MCVFMYLLLMKRFSCMKTGIRMHYVEMGQGPTVILLHGFPEFWFIWKYQVFVIYSYTFDSLQL